MQEKYNKIVQSHKHMGMTVDNLSDFELIVILSITSNAYENYILLTWTIQKYTIPS